MYGTLLSSVNYVFCILRYVSRCGTDRTGRERTPGPVSEASSRRSVSVLNGVERY